MRFALAVCVLLALVASSGSQDPKPPDPKPPAPAPKGPAVTIPPAAACLVGRNVHIAIASSDDTPANWSVVGPGKLGEDYDVIEEIKRDAPPSTVNLVFTAYTVGTYWIVASHGKGSKHATCQIAATVPIPPKPPDPPMPTPDDTLKAKIQAAYTSDAGSSEQKAAWRGSLVAIYNAMPAHIDALAKTATTTDAIAALKSLISSVIPAATSLANVRGVVRDQLEAAVGTSPTQVLDDATRTKAKNTFQLLGAALGAAK